MEFFLIGVFSILDLLLFCIFFESVLIPMYLIYGLLGSPEKKAKIVYTFLLCSYLTLVFYGFFAWVHLLF